jgi:hypothetical protein
MSHFEGAADVSYCLPYKPSGLKVILKVSFLHVFHCCVLSRLSISTTQQLGLHNGQTQDRLATRMFLITIFPGFAVGTGWDHILISAGQSSAIFWPWNPACVLNLSPPIHSNCNMWECLPVVYQGKVYQCPEWYLIWLLGIASWLSYHLRCDIYEPAI